VKKFKIFFLLCKLPTLVGNFLIERVVLAGGVDHSLKVNGYPVQAVFYPCGNFSDTSNLKLLKTKGLIGHACIRTENHNQVSFYPFVPCEISVLAELALGHLRYHLTDVPPQPNSRPDSVFDMDRPAHIYIYLNTLLEEAEVVALVFYLKNI